MTFRSRLVWASALAVAIAVVLASGASWVVARNALLQSTDETLEQAAQNALARPFIDPSETDGAIVQVVGDGGTILLASQAGTLPVDARVVAVASGRSPATFQTIVIQHVAFRELIVPLSVGQQINDGLQSQYLTDSGAMQLIVPLASVNHQLRRLELTLLLVVAGGILIAIVLGLLVARTAIGPLNNVTESIEELAETTDMAQRLDEGGPDELGRLRRAFNHLFSALERSQDQQRQLVLDASHELRTPLTSLRTNTEVLRRVDELDATTKEQLIDDVLTQLSELTTLVGDLAELARGEHHVEMPTRLRLDLLVDDLVAIDSTHARTRNVEIVTTLEECWVHGRRSRLSRAIGNLIDNAIKWSPPGGVVDVSVSAGRVTVRDRGPGIDPNDRDKVFDRFYRAPSARALPGSGLGLAIVAQVAEEEGGSIAVADAPGGGALLILELPTVI